MKKVKWIGAVLLCASMTVSLFGCSSGKDEKEDKETDDGEDEITIEVDSTTTEETEETTEETSEETDPEPTPTPEPAPVADIISNDGSQYEIIMQKIDEIEEQTPGSTYLITRSWGSDMHWVLSSFEDEKYHEYVISNGVIVETDDHLYIPEKMQLRSYDYDAVSNVPFLFDMNESMLINIVSGEPLKNEVVDGTFASTIYGVSDDLKYAYISYGNYVEFDESYVSSLQTGDVVEIPLLGESTVIEVTDDYIELDNNMTIRKQGLCDTYDDDMWYLAENDFAFVCLTYLAVIEIADDCKVIEGENYGFNEYTEDELSQYSGKGLADTYYATKLPGDADGLGLPVLDNNGWYSCSEKSSCVTQIKISGGKITEMHIEYPYGI